LKYLGLRIEKIRGADAAEPTFLRLLALERQLVQRSNGHLYYKNCLATDLTNWGQMLAEVGRIEEAEKFLREAVAVQPSNAHSANGLAWFLSQDPKVVRKRRSEAVKLAHEAVERKPENWMYWNTLGLALAREGDWKAASRAIETSIKLNKQYEGGVAHDWFVLAIIRWNQGKRSEARDLYEKGVDWMAANPKADMTELRRFREEAAKLLHLPTSQLAAD